MYEGDFVRIALERWVTIVVVFSIKIHVTN